LEVRWKRIAATDVAKAMSVKKRHKNAKRNREWTRMNANRNLNRRFAQIREAHTKTLRTKEDPSLYHNETSSNILTRIHVLAKTK